MHIDSSRVKLEVAHGNLKQLHNVATLMERSHVGIDYLYIVRPIQVCAEQLLVRDATLILP